MIRSMLPKIALFALLLMFCSAEFVLAQPGGGGRFGGGGGGGGFMGGGSALGLLSDKKVQDELEIVDDQAEAIQGLQEEMRSSMGEMFSGMRDRFRDMDDTERQDAMTEIRDKMTTTMKDFDAKVYEELLPHQISRLKQLVAQSQGRRGGGLTGGQVSESLVEDLGITEEQIEAMKEKAEKVRSDLTAKINKLRAQAEDEILSVLDPGQRAKYKEMVGDPFEFDNGGGGGFGRGGQGGPGGPGGQRGGGQRGGDRGGDQPRGGGAEF